MIIKPFGNNILVRPHERETILKTQEGSLSEYGEVLAVGKDVSKEIQVGDTIGFTIWGINALEIDGNKAYLVPCTSEFILAKIEM